MILSFFSANIQQKQRKCKKSRKITIIVINKPYNGAV